jgi:hypothetical protein
MTFSERMKELLEQGVTATKEFAVKAGAKAQDLGEQGVLMVEIRQLEGKAQKILSRLGNEAYHIFAELNLHGIDKDMPAIKDLLTEIAGVREAIELKETALRNKRS